MDKLLVNQYSTNHQNFSRYFKENVQNVKIVGLKLIGCCSRVIYITRSKWFEINDWRIFYTKHSEVMALELLKIFEVKIIN